MTYYIPPRDYPADIVTKTDPVTGATYLRPRSWKKVPDNDFAGTPKAATCSTPYCKRAGLPHERCIAQDPFDPIHAYPAHVRFNTPLPTPLPPHRDPLYVPAVNPAMAAYARNPATDTSPSTSNESNYPESRDNEPFVPPRPLPTPPSTPPIDQSYPQYANTRYPDEPFYARAARDAFDQAQQANRPLIPPRPGVLPRPRRFSGPRGMPDRPVIPPRPDIPPRPFVPPRPPRGMPDPPVIPASPPDAMAEENAFRRWQQSFPHWNIPREMPPDWRPPGQRERRHRARNVAQPFQPYASPWRSPYHVPMPIPPAVLPGSDATGYPNLPPDRIVWDNVRGGTLQWTPHPWVPHPLPHPEIPAQAFWNYPGYVGPLQPWRGPGGWSPYYGLDPERMNLITGGHPLPGMDPYWTPAHWVPPLHTPQYGVIISRWLTPNPRNSDVPFVLWDAAVQPPYLIRRLTSRGNIVDFATTDFFKEPATYPPVRTVQVNLQGMRSSWGPVVINKDSPIEVGDVFNAVWTYLQKPITQDDWQAIVNTYGRRRGTRIEYAMRRRCTIGGGLYDYLWSQGIKRVDLLEGNTVYWGTYLTYNADLTWSLTMAFLPANRPVN